MIVGLTGGIGSGKSTVLTLFHQLGIPIVISDEITRQLLTPEQPIFKIVVKHFGSQILNKDGSLHRTKLRSLIFKSIDERRFLETLLHPLVKAEILAKFSILPPNSYGVVEIPLLIEANFQDAVNRILVIDCSEELQIQRATQRDKTSLNEIKAILNSQATRAERLSFADDVIDNNADLASLKAKIIALNQYYKELSSQITK